MPTMPLCSIVAFALCIGANADDALLHITQYADFLIINGPLRQFIRTLSSRSVICQGRAGEGCPCFYGRASEIRTAVHHSHTVQLQVFIHHTPKVLVFLHYSNLLNTDIKLLFSSLNSLLICITPHFSTLTSTDHSQHHSAKISTPCHFTRHASKHGVIFPHAFTEFGRRSLIHQFALTVNSFH